MELRHARAKTPAALTSDGWPSYAVHHGGIRASLPDGGPIEPGHRHAAAGLDRFVAATGAARPDVLVSDVRLRPADPQQLDHVFASGPMREWSGCHPS